MSIVPRWWRPMSLGLVLLAGLYGCVVGPGYYDEGVGVGYVGGYYEPYDDDYGWAPGFFVGPPRGRVPRHGPGPHRPYRPAPSSRPVPSIPNHPRGHLGAPAGPRGGGPRGGGPRRR
ncbi:MAG TPA: hypothetical protein VHX52_00840 [Steroidobacteraceae bacterium]|jgi:hypothetical protein|nr:hypothetical protein [Steroidobacteraceae bacterium]